MSGNLTLDMDDFSMKQDALNSFFGLLIASFLPLLKKSRQGECSVSNPDKLDCGFFGSTQAYCEAKGCCWKPIEPNPKNVPWCYYTSDVEDTCATLNWKAPTPGGFDDDFYGLMFKKFLSQLNVENSGAVVAAPDRATPGGSYYFHWMRDAGLSIKTYLEISNNDYERVRTELDMYTKWVEKVQKQNDSNTIDVRVEPKFYIPDGTPFDGSWCRPQTDGPALRAVALSKWGTILHISGQGDPNHIWSLVQFDLDWVKKNWSTQGCDLWEEVISDDFFFNRMAYVYSLNVAADFGDLIGQSGGDIYRALADTIKASIQEHWKSNEGYLYQSTNRPMDGSVIHSIVTFGQFLYPPESEEAASTVNVLSKKFCREYAINQQENKMGNPGILIGRYPGDVYAGGNPWQLLTAATAEFFYLGGHATLDKIRSEGIYYLNEIDNKRWLDLLNLHPGTSSDEFAIAQLEAGDAVMTRLYNFTNSLLEMIPAFFKKDSILNEQIKNDDGRIDEQIDRNTGKQASAKSLTWSYANILHSLHVRKGLQEKMKDVLRSAI